MYCKCCSYCAVSIPKLTHKLDKYGISGLLCSCVKSFLTNRCQWVIAGNALSESLPLISGTPQDSVLGPILFLLHKNVLPDLYTESQRAKLFADDLKSYNLFDYRNNPDSIQASLDSLISWSKTWQLKLAVAKCSSLLLKGKSSFIDE